MHIGQKPECIKNKIKQPRTRLSYFKRCDNFFSGLNYDNVKFVSTVDKAIHLKKCYNIVNKKIYFDCVYTGYSSYL